MKFKTDPWLTSGPPRQKLAETPSELLSLNADMALHYRDNDH